MLINKFNLILSINSKITQFILYVQSVYLKANKFCYQNLSWRLNKDSCWSVLNARGHSSLDNWPLDCHGSGNILFHRKLILFKEETASLNAYLTNRLAHFPPLQPRGAVSMTNSRTPYWW